MAQDTKKKTERSGLGLPLLIGARSTLAVTEAGATLTFHVRGRKKRV